MTDQKHVSGFSTRGCSFVGVSLETAGEAQRIGPNFPGDPRHQKSREAVPDAVCPGIE
jgi:hypothetical protein